MFYIQSFEVWQHGIVNIWSPWLKWLEHVVQTLGVPLGMRHFLAQKLQMFLKNIDLPAENECSCLCTVHISDVNFINKNINWMNKQLKAKRV